MPADLDKSGALRLQQRVYLGPSLGWIQYNVTDLVNIEVAGTTNIPFGITFVKVNVAGLVTVQLASSIPAIGVIASPITVGDIAGNAATFPITILPYATEQIMGLPSIQITVAYGSFTLEPLATGGWVQQ